MRLSLTLLLTVSVAAPALALDHAQFVRQLASAHAAPRAERFAQAAAGLRVATEALCLSPAPVAAEKARGAYRDAFLAWQGVQHLRAGPLEQNARAERLQFWPDDRGAVRRRLDQLIAAADAEAATQVGIAKGSVATQGFPALEKLLYGDAPAAAGGYPCRLAAAIAGNVAEIGAQIAAAWTLTAQGAPLAGTASPAEATQLLAAAWVGQMEVMAGKKISDPAGADVKGVKGGLQEAPLSELSVAALRADADALLDLLKKDGPVRAAIAAAPAPGGEAAATRTTAALTDLRRSLDAFSDPLTATLKTPAGRKAAIAATLRIDAARGLLAEQLPGALGVEFGFNNRDGD